MKDRSLSNDSTIYSYTLIKKLSVPRAADYCYWLLPMLLLLLAFSGTAPVRSAVWIVAGYLIVLALQTGLALLYARVKGAVGLLQGTFRWAGLWAGWRPSGYVPVASVFRLTVQVLCAGTAFIGIGYIWLPGFASAVLFLLHLWLLLPRLLVLTRLKKLNPDGMVKLSGREFSLYVA